MAETPRSQRTEKPTGRRIAKAVEKGQVIRSSEITGVLVLAAFLVFCHALGSSWIEQVKSLIQASFSHVARPDLTSDGVMRLLMTTAWTSGALLAPPLGLMLAAGVAGNLVQGPPPFSFEPLKLNLSRLNPAANIARIFSLKQLVEVLKSLLKLALFFTVALTAARDSLTDLSASSPGPGGVMEMLFHLGGTIIFRVMLLAAFLAVFDYLIVRFDYHRSLRMTKQEVKEEHKEIDINPLVKQRIRSRQIALARSRMMAEVPKATVVVTNPTHFAVALRYVAGGTDVPEVVAKGRNLLAEKIKQIAASHGIPIVEDAPLARSLYRLVPVGGGIPAALYRAVAEVLALVMSSQRRARAAANPGESTEASP